MNENPKTISLIGFMATGKTTVGQQLAVILGWEFLDTDSMIEATARMTIPEIFLLYGEAHFRALESEIVCEVCDQQSSVISFGGGAPLDRVHADMIAQKTVVVLLSASIGTLMRRLSGKRTRPLLAGAGEQLRERLLEMHDERRPVYERLADLEISTDDKSPNETASEIIRRLQL